MSSIEIGKIEAGHKEEEDIGCIWCLGHGFLGEIGVRHEIYNATEKEIKYINITYVAINRVKDVICRKEIAFVGPLEAYTLARLTHEDLWYEETIVDIAIEKAEIDYMDGTSESIEGNSIKFIDDENSTYNLMKAREKTKKETERKSRGVVVHGGETDDKKFKTYKTGNITFYLDGGTALVGWESTASIKVIELPDAVEHIRPSVEESLENIGIMLPRRMTCISYWHPTRADLYITNGVKRVVIPKETEQFNAKSGMLGSIREIEFEDPCGWGVSKRIINDPKKMYEYIVRKGEVQLHKSFIKKIIYKLGL